MAWAPPSSYPCHPVHPIGGSYYLFGPNFFLTEPSKMRTFRLRHSVPQIHRQFLSRCDATQETTAPSLCHWCRLRLKILKSQLFSSTISIRCIYFALIARHSFVPRHNGDGNAPIVQFSVEYAKLIVHLFKNKEESENLLSYGLLERCNASKSINFNSCAALPRDSIKCFVYICKPVSSVHRMS